MGALVLPGTYVNLLYESYMYIYIEATDITRYLENVYTVSRRHVDPGFSLCIYIFYFPIFLVKF